MEWLLGAVGLYLGFLALAAIFSVRPVRIPAYLSPAALELPQEDVRIDTPSSRLRAWCVDHPSPRGVAVFVHGYIMNRCEWVPTARRLYREGFACLLVDLRAHGGSTGKTCTLGIREAEDVRASVEYAKARWPGLPIACLGSSMGGAASAYALEASPELFDVLVLDSCYGKLSDASRRWWLMFFGTFAGTLMSPSVFLGSALARINPNRADVATSLRTIRQPVLLLHGARDFLVPVPTAERNHNAAAGPKKLVIFPESVHSEARWKHSRLYHQVLLEFLEEHLVGPSTKEQATRHG